MLEGFIEVTPILNSGVYALLYQGAVVYIGQSKKMLTRIYSHRYNRGRDVPKWLPPSLKGIVFDQVYVMPCPEHQLDELERAMIDLYKPRLNIKLKYPAPAGTELTITLPNGAVIPFNAKPEPIHRRYG